MASSFKGLNLFGSGPHRFIEDKRGLLTFLLVQGGVPTPGRVISGELEVTVRVTGRLVSATEAGLWALRDAITAQITDPPNEGTLVDPFGRTWKNMAPLSFEVTAPVERGRVVSVAYEAVFANLLNY